MKVLLLLLLLPFTLRAQQTYQNAEYAFSLRYPTEPWRRVAEPKAGTNMVFQLTAGSEKRPEAYFSVYVTPVPAEKQGLSLEEQRKDYLEALRKRFDRYNFEAVGEVAEHKIPPYKGFLYSYYYKLPLYWRVHVLVLCVQRGGQLYALEYSCRDKDDTTYQPLAYDILNSLTFAALPNPLYAYTEAVCDGKAYGVPYYDGDPAQRVVGMRSVHEFANGVPDPATAVLHHNAFPFQTVALTKGFDNNLYAVAYDRVNEPKYVYCYRPATHQGDYTPWLLPAQGEYAWWISGGTDSQGNLYFMTSDGSQLVYAEPSSGEVFSIWNRAPKASFQFDDGFGTRISNFGFDEHDVLYIIHSLNGTVYRYDFHHDKELPPLKFALPYCNDKFNYSDVLFQRTAQGEAVMYVSGAGKLFKVNARTLQAVQLADTYYTELAGCNIYRPAPPAAAPAQATWRGRLLDDSTRQPLPQARLLPAAPAPAVAVDAGGAFAWSARPGTAYAYEARLPGYFTVRDSWTATAAGRTQDILLKKLRVGASFVLDNVQFQQGKPVMLPGAEAALRKLLALLKEYPAMTIELAGHTDNVGPADKNQQLSQERVEVVKASLVRQGIGAERITGRGYGGTRPKASNADEATRRLNRRVEFTITGLD